MTAVLAELLYWNLVVSPNSYQFSCSALTSFIQPQSRYHCREIRSPNTRHKNGSFTDLSMQEKALVNQTTCRSRYFATPVWQLSEVNSEMIPAPLLELPM